MINSFITMKYTVGQYCSIQRKIIYYIVFAIRQSNMNKSFKQLEISNESPAELIVDKIMVI